MRDSPDGAELLRIARATLLQELLPQLPARSRYPALMVANAMGIASRELGATGAHTQAVKTLFRELYGAQAETEASGERELAARLAQDLRTGEFDGEMLRVGELLLAEVRERLRISRPKYLR